MEFKDSIQECHNSGGETCIVRYTDIETQRHFYVVRQYDIYVSRLQCPDDTGNLTFVHHRSWSMNEIISKENRSGFFSSLGFDLQEFGDEFDI